MSEHGSRRAAPSSRGGPGGGRRSASAGGFGDKVSGLSASLSGMFSRRGNGDGDDGYGDDVVSGGSGGRGGRGGGNKNGKKKYNDANPPPKDWWMRFVDYPRYGKRGWRHWMPSIKQILSIFLAFVFSIIGLVSLAYANTKVPDSGHFIADGKPTQFTYDDGTSNFASVGLPYNKVTPSQIPQVVQDAVTSAEDYSFFSNPGVSFTGVARSALNNLFGSGGKQGGSTITQQYVKNQFLSQDQTFSRKINEVFLSIKLTHQEGKQQILTDYLNSISFGRGAIGIDAAATTYFGKGIKDVTSPDQAAFLAAMIQSPSIYSGPFIKGSLTPDTKKYSETIHPIAYGTFLKRYNQVLANMRDYKKISPAVAASFQDKLPPVQAPVTEKLGGYVGYMKEAATDYLAKVHTADPTNPYTDIDNLQKGGYTVVTTFNHQMMDDAQKAANQGLWQNTSLGGKWDPAKHPADKNVHLAFSAVDPRTGQVKAFYSGVDGVEDYNVNSFNSALYGGIQVGSTFKAFTLATALETGLYSADSQEPGTNKGLRTLYEGPDAGAGSCVPTNPAGDKNCVAMTYKDKSGNKVPWPPNEDDEAGGGANGMATLRTGFEQSLNSVFADLEMEQNIGPRAVEQMAVKLGLDPKQMTVSPALTLGSAAITPMRMANAYATFANGGTYHDPVMVTEIIKADTKQVVWRAPNTAGTRVMQQNTAATVADVMKGVLNSKGGTAAANKDVQSVPGDILKNMAGKTGTTDFGYSAWFNGYSGTLATAVGLYRQDASQTLLPLQGLESSTPTQRVNGNSYPTSVWASFMKIEAAKNPSTFAPAFLPFTNTCTGTGSTPLPPAASPLGTPSNIGANGCANVFTPTPTPTPTPTTTTVAPPPLPQNCAYGIDMATNQCMAPPTTTDAAPTTPTDSQTTSTTPPVTTTSVSCHKNPLQPGCATTTPPTSTTTSTSPTPSIPTPSTGR